LGLVIISCQFNHFCLGSVHACDQDKHENAKTQNAKREDAQMQNCTLINVKLNSIRAKIQTRKRVRNAKSY
jgi:hypothetical protein